MPPTHRPHWQLPPGVSRGTWDYVQSTSVADDYDDYFAFNSLFEFDEQVLTKHLQPPGLVVDLGCGTGRALVPLVRKRHRGIAVDLSDHMLRIVREKAEIDDLPIECLQANLVELDAVSDDTADHAICMFSTLGMIRGCANRRRALGHFRRILRPGGRFVLHVHNYWFNLRDPGGPGWLVKNLLTAPRSSDIEIGDKWFPYRGVQNMYLHVFRWRELAADLASADFAVVQRIPLDVARRHRLRWPWLFGALRTNGWIVVCE
ncbi:MAG: class I SAM-dependent methyltransferase [Planctomycetota bacterium]